MIKKSESKRKKRAFITGITGQDGSYLSELLLEKGYEVFGLVRRISHDATVRLGNLEREGKVTLLDGNLRDIGTIQRALEIAQPDEIYNLAAQSDVGVSFRCPEETMEVNYYGLGRLVNAAMKQNPKVRIYQAATSEMFGSSKPPQSEKTAFAPVSPYGESKLKGYQDFVEGYRKSHGLFICSGILFNHESPRRGVNFVTRKITSSLARIKLGLQETLELGNLEAKRDWGYAKDYVEAMWRMLQQDKPQDFVISTGISHKVRDFVNASAAALGVKLKWSGGGVDEVARDENGKVIVRVNPQFYRPVDVHYLLGDSRKAQRALKWKHSVTFEELVKLMTEADFAELSRNK